MNGGTGMRARATGAWARQRRWDSLSFRLGRLLLFGLCYAAVDLARVTLFPTGRDAVLWWEKALQMTSWAWTAAFPAVVVAAVSLLLPAVPRSSSAGRRREIVVCYRIVSRGRNAEALAETVASIRECMIARPLFRYRIEVVTDEQVGLPSGADLAAYVVPSDYRTPKGSLYKARALHYLSAESPLPETAWIFHCDEESQVTAGLVGGIRDAVVEEEDRAAAGLAPRIGQGAILYWRSLRKHPVLTLADMLRTGDDVSRFRTQFRTGSLFCGMHGSFILVRADIERSVSFDVGPEGSITEDAWWAFEQAYQGRDFRWVDGYLLEQSPEHWKDFAKQRRRWYSGLWKVCLYAPAPFLARLAMMSFLVAWVVSAVGGVYTLVNLFAGLSTPAPARVLGGLVFAWYVSSYLTGLWLNLRSMPDSVRPGRLGRAVLYVAQVVLLPLFGTLEAAGVFAALLWPERGFHVIRKSGAAPAVVDGTGEAAGAPAVGGSAVGAPVVVTTPARQPKQQRKKPLVLVADDDADILAMIATKLRSEGFSVVTATNGNQAIAQLRAQSPDLAFLDVAMPGRTGWEVCRLVRAEPALDGVRLVLLTALTAEADVRTGFEAGADDYLSKPFSPRDVVAVTRQALEGVGV